MLLARGNLRGGGGTVGSGGEAYGGEECVWGCEAESES